VPAPSFEADVLFVGAGVSTSYTLLALLDRLHSSPPTKPIRIVVVERADDAYGGLPYGDRSGHTSLIITSLKDFLPPTERERFAAWLASNKGWAFDRFRAEGGALSAKWWTSNERAIADNDWNNLYLPRTVFGAYIADRVQTAIDTYGAEGWLHVTLLHDTVTAIRPHGDGYVVSNSASTICQARQIVLAIGTTPNAGRLTADESLPAALCLIDQPYEPSIADTLNRIHATLDRVGSTVRVLLVGGNASTLEMLYLLNDSSHEQLRSAEYYVLSPRGILPERLVDARADVAFEPLALNALRPEACTARQVYEAAIADISCGTELGLTVSDTLAPISRAIGAVVSSLPLEEKASFAQVWGVAIGRFQRRAGTEYSDLVDELTANGRLRLVAGTFRRVGSINERGATFQFDAAGELRTFPEPMTVIVNCSGFSPVTGQQSRTLLDQLLADGLCRATAGGTGIAVDDDFQARRNLFLMGPLLAGNVVSGGAIWHMEHCGRVSTFGARLGGMLAGRLSTADR
jgi:uncharacterized NAD(P)/FAD-binding protein YdhS